MRVRLWSFRCCALVWFLHLLYSPFALRTFFTQEATPPFVLQMPPKMDNMQRLLKAEDDRNRLINDARQKKLTKVKQAKGDAEKAVEVFKRAKDDEVEAFRQQQLGGAEGERSKVVQQADQQIVAMRRTATERMPQVTRTLVDFIWSVK